MAASGVLEIDPRGDIVLVCGGSEHLTKIHVSSHILTLASPVFKSMLVPHFKEGHTLAKSASIELPLPEDDPKAMATMCQVLHFRNKAIPTILTPEHILDVAVVADKYDCTEAMMPSAQCWISEHLNTADTKAGCTLLIASYYFQHSSLFHRIGKALIMKSKDQLWTPGQSIHEHCPEILEKVLCILEAKRKASLSEAAAIIEKEMAYEKNTGMRLKNGHSCTPTCTYGGMRFANFTQELMSKNLWPTSDLESRGLTSALGTMENLELEATEAKACTSGMRNHRCVAITALSFNQDSCVRIRAGAKSLKTKISSACYGCAREGKAVGMNQCGVHQKSVV